MGYGGILKCTYCGYQTERLMLGSGFSGPDVYNGIVARCDYCQILVNVNLALKRRYCRCPKCRKKLILLNTNNFIDIPCPRCGKTGMEFIDEFLWD
jgi:predicted RNA-binding Zn-ribbon protein involved in translation (DUF1610 family)